MLIPVNEFFRNLPDKCCTECGNVIPELADCYMTKCDKCSGTEFFNYAVYNK